MIKTIRMIIAEWLLGKAVNVVPKNDEGALLAYHVGQYMEEAIARRNYHEQ